jgi:hypothetical protein
MLGAPKTYGKSHRGANGVNHQHATINSSYGEG